MARPDLYPKRYSTSLKTDNQGITKGYTLVVQWYNQNMNRAQQHHITTSIKPYVLAAMKAQFGDKCAECGEKKHAYDIDHMRYSDKVTIYDLQLLCQPCHKVKSEVDNEAWLSRTPHCSSCNCYE